MVILFPTLNLIRQYIEFYEDFLENYFQELNIDLYNNSSLPIKNVWNYSFYEKENDRNALILSSYDSFDKLYAG